MRAPLLVIIMLMSGMPSAAAQPGTLVGSQLREAVSGRTIYLSAGWGVELPVAYRPNGTMSGRLNAFAAALAGGNGQSDRGRWWIARNQLCQRGRNWLDGRAYCYRIAVNGGTVHWRRNDGRSGTARIGR